MDLTDTIVPKSDQLNAEDLLSHPVTVTITGVNKGSAEQPVNIELQEFPNRQFRPSKTVRRLLVAAWGAEASAYVGRRMTLYRDEKVRFGGQEVGGIRVSALSHIDKPLTIALTETRGKRKTHTVQPLRDPQTDAGAQAPAATGGSGRSQPTATAPASPAWTAAVAAASTEDELRAVWARFKPTDEAGRADLTRAMTARRDELQEES